jgi:hypothetical protein
MMLPQTDLYPLLAIIPTSQSAKRHKEKTRNNPPSHSSPMKRRSQVAPLLRNRKKQAESPRPGQPGWQLPRPNNIVVALFGSNWGPPQELVSPQEQYLPSPVQLQVNHRAAINHA